MWIFPAFIFLIYKLNKYIKLITNTLIYVIHNLNTKIIANVKIISLFFTFALQNGSLQLSSASQSLLKNQHILLNSAQPTIQTQQQQQPQQQTAQQRLSIMPKLNIKMEPQISGLLSLSIRNVIDCLVVILGISLFSVFFFCEYIAFGLPPTPPSSLSSEDSEGNQSPEHNLSPMSPPAPATSSRRSSSLQNSPNRGYTSTSSRQPIHTPLISSQPVQFYTE